jgi:hypothetical protein
MNTANAKNAPYWSEDSYKDEDLDFRIVIIFIAVMVYETITEALKHGFQELPAPIRDNLGLATAIAACSIVALPEWSTWIVTPFVIGFAGCIGGWIGLSMVESVTDHSEDYFGGDAGTFGRSAFVLALPAAGLAILAALR